MNLRSILNIVFCCLVVLEFVAGEVFFISSTCCQITDVYVVCREVDPRGYSYVEYGYKPAWSVSIVDSPHLSVVPKGLVAAFELRMSNTQVTHLSADDFLLAGLVKKLDFSSNEICTISRDAFVEITHLRYLNLSSNQLEALPAGLFAGNPYLQKVDLGENCLTTIALDLFAGKPVEFLDLSFNNFSENLGFLQNMPNLTTLDLSGNCIRHLAASTFVRNTQLQKLFLAQACIDSLDYGSFPYDTLKELDLSYNPLENTDYRVFNSITSLEKLHLRGSQVDLENVRLLMSILELRKIELEPDFYLCRDLAPVVSEMRKHGLTLIVPEPFYETSNINGLKCKNIH